MKIYAPNIHLFAFALYKGANVDPTSVQADKIQLWQSADNIVHTTLNQDLHLSQRIDIHKEPGSLRVDLLKDSEVKDGNSAVDVEGKISFDTQQVVIKGLVSPLRLHDSYGLWLNLRRPEKEDDTRTEDVDIDFLSKLNKNNCFTLEKDKFFLGQTLLITAWLTGAKDEKLLPEIAQECLEAVFPNPSQCPPFSRQGELFGSPIFEYGLFKLANYQHVLIWLFRDSKADENFNLCYQELLDLFFFRTKVVKAYQDSRITYHAVASAYKEIENAIDKLPKKDEYDEVTTDELKDLKNKLKELPQLALKYTRLLRNLEDYQNTIVINESNYSEKLQQIGGIIQNGDLLFLKSFSQENSPFFQKQIQADLGYFRHGSSLLEQALASIRGIVEIEQAERDIQQAERDRSLENTIQIVGVGLGAGAIVSGVVTQHIDKINQPLSAISPNNPPHPFYASLLLSILATLFFSALAWLWTKCKN
ncbi:hypothetical protein [Brasilonema sp. UFV-L1]|uniref:hypothetical protein n=1 Tax=Brasilonema sp. UFV-L1 TaxID=2234130 RepID=UPI00145E22C0|nr:hypothetical protein [Brasilonema sp. UFV-L1]NMG11581.1 hypothetical protein [Brasilonema sp. UFV-L1]